MLADDSEDDIFLMKRAFRSAEIELEDRVARDGEEVISMLTALAKDSNCEESFPGMLLLDLKMPKKGGFEVLEWVRSQEYLRRLVVIVITSSMAQADVDRAYDLGVNGFLVKPSEYAELIAMMKRLTEFWLRDNRWPRCCCESR